MRRTRVWLILLVLVAVVAGAGAPAQAWTQYYNADSTTAACSPCYKIVANVPHRYRAGGTWPSGWVSTMNDSFQRWNALRPPALNPVWSQTTSTDESILVGRGPIDPGIQGQTRMTSTGTQNGQPVILYATITISNAYVVDLTYNTDPSRIYLPSLLAHEIGHAGEALSHSRIDGNLMVQYKTDRIAPGPDDYNGIRAIYG